MPEPCLNTANAYLHKFRVLEGEDDVAVFISIAVLKLHDDSSSLQFVESERLQHWSYHDSPVCMRYQAVLPGLQQCAQAVQSPGHSSEEGFAFLAVGLCHLCHRAVPHGLRPCRPLVRLCLFLWSPADSCCSAVPCCYSCFATFSPCCSPLLCRPGSC